MDNKKENLTAAQRLDRLEQSVFTVDQALGGLSQMTDVIRQSVRLLGRKADAIVAISEKGLPVNNETVGQAMEDQTVKELKELIDEFKNNGSLITSETITPETLIVARESNAETGKVTKQRLQFPFMDIQDEMKPLLIGKKVGDIIRFDEKPFDVEILEVYQIVTPKTPVDQSANPEQAPLN